MTRRTQTVLVVLFVSLLLGAGAYLFAKQFVPLFRAEDNLVEWLSVAFYLLGVLSGFRGLLTQRMAASTKGWVIGFSTLCMFGVLDELSFGERVFGFTPPELDGVSLDGVHDLFSLFAAQISDVSSSVSVVVWILAAFVLAAVALMSVFFFGVFCRHGGNREAAWLLAGFSILIGAALVIDLHLIRFGPIVLIEETFEMVAALTLWMTVSALVNPETSREQ